MILRVPPAGPEPDVLITAPHSAGVRVDAKSFVDNLSSCETRAIKRLALCELSPAQQKTLRRMFHGSRLVEVRGIHQEGSSRFWLVHDDPDAEDSERMESTRRGTLRVLLDNGFAQNYTELFPFRVYVITDIGRVAAEALTHHDEQGGLADE